MVTTSASHRSTPRSAPLVVGLGNGATDIRRIFVFVSRTAAEFLPAGTNGRGCSVGLLLCDFSSFYLCILHLPHRRAVWTYSFSLGSCFAAFDPELGSVASTSFCPLFSCGHTADLQQSISHRRQRRKGLSARLNGGHCGLILSLLVCRSYHGP